MRRVALYGIGWLAAATVAVLLAWQGVGRVGTNVTDRHAEPLTAEQARQELERTRATADGSEPVGGPAPSTGEGGQPGPTSPASTTTTRPRSAPSSTTRPNTSTPSTTATTGPGSSPSTTTPTSPPSTTVTRTYNLIGGSATLRFSPSGVTVVLADPKPGFSADIDDDGGRVRIRFESDSHRSQLEAWWDGGPRDEVREDGDDGGSGPG